jgi:nicotinamide mononucleotide adenylyltransferase
MIEIVLCLQLLYVFVSFIMARYLYNQLQKERKEKEYYITMYYREKENSSGIFSELYSVKHKHRALVRLVDAIRIQATVTELEEIGAEK